MDKYPKPAAKKTRNVKTSNVENMGKKGFNDSDDVNDDEPISSRLRNRSRGGSSVRNLGSMGSHTNIANDQDDNRNFHLFSIDDVHESADQEHERRGQKEENSSGNRNKRLVKRSNSSSRGDRELSLEAWLPPISQINQVRKKKNSRSITNRGAAPDNDNVGAVNRENSRTNSGKIMMRNKKSGNDQKFGGNNGIDLNFPPETSSLLSNPNCQVSSGGEEKLSGDDNNVVGANLETRRTGLRDVQNAGDMARITKGPSDGNGVKEWLNDLGLGKYLGVFEAHAVNEHILPFLTIDDLKDMGIHAVGARRRMYCLFRKRIGRNIGGNGIDLNNPPESSLLSDPNRQVSCGGEDKLTGDDDNIVGVDLETRRLGLRNDRNSGEMRTTEVESDVNGVKEWLNDLGLVKYFGLFENHEVDEEVLPLLTIDDLKDMGIHAVGPRTEMHCSIQRLGRQFSKMD